MLVAASSLPTRVHFVKATLHCLLYIESPRHSIILSTLEKNECFFFFSFFVWLFVCLFYHIFSLSLRRFLVSTKNTDIGKLLLLLKSYTWTANKTHVIRNKEKREQRKVAREYKKRAAKRYARTERKVACVRWKFVIPLLHHLTLFGQKKAQNASIRFIGWFKAARDTRSHYVCIYLKSMHELQRSRPTANEIFMRVFSFKAFCISNYTLLFSSLCPARWNAANYHK